MPPITKPSNTEMGESKPKTKSKKKTEKFVPLTEEIIISDKLRNDAQKRMESTGDGVIGFTINSMLKSRFRLLYLRSHEERRVIKFFEDLCIYRGFDLFHWDCDRGLLNANNRERVTPDGSEVEEEATAILAYILDYAMQQSKVLRKKKKPKGTIFLLLDFHEFMDNPFVQRKLREFSEIISASTIIIVSPIFNCPPTLEKEISLLDFPIPSYNEISASLKKMAKEVSIQLPHAAKEAKQNEEDIVSALSGLTLSEAENALAMSVISEGTFDIPRILDEKKQMIRKGGILEYRDPRFTLDDMGGLDTLKDWFKLRRLAFKEDARKFGLPAPKGVLLVGIPGCVLPGTKIKIKKVSNEGGHQIFAE